MDPAEPREDGNEAPAPTKRERQVDIRSASYRVLDDTPGHVRYGVWVNGGKCGDLTVRQEESVAFRLMMDRAGFRYDPALSPHFPDDVR